MWGLVWRVVVVTACAGLYGGALAAAFSQWFGPAWAWAALLIDIPCAWVVGTSTATLHLQRRKLEEHARYWGGYYGR